MNDMNEMTTVLDQHVQAVLNPYAEDLFTYKVSHAGLAIVPGATKEKAIPELDQRSRNEARTVSAFGH
ncbi:MAG: hypothetical protein WAK90_23980 [Pseudolabrys sp.]